MTQFLIRRILTMIPTLLVISFVVFAILDLSPSDPVANLPLSIPNEVREKIREKLGANDPFLIKYVKWLQQFVVDEPISLFESVTGVKFAGSEERVRILSWQTRGPVVDLVLQRRKLFDTTCA